MTQDILAWIWNLAVSDKLYKKYSICPHIRLNCECAIHCSFWSSPLDGKLGTCNSVMTLADMKYHCSFYVCNYYYHYNHFTTLCLGLPG